MKRSISLSKWSLYHAWACLAATGAAMYWVVSWPLACTGLVSFSLLAISQRKKWTPAGIWGHANTVTLARFGLIMSIFLVENMPWGGIYVLVAGITVLVADGWDGWLARRRNEASEFGEYFDKESDAFFVLALCMLAYIRGLAGAWILVPGLLRYLFVLTLFFLKPTLGKEYRSRWARVVYVCMVSALMGMFILPDYLYSPLIILATIALLLSFAHYFKWLAIETIRFKPPGNGATLLLALLAFLFLNSLLLIPSYWANVSTSTFFPIPDPTHPTTTLTWNRGWYDYFLYFFIRRPNQDLFRLCVDMVVIATGLIVFRNNKRMPVIMTVVYISLFVYELYDAAAFAFFHRHGILYEDTQYAINLYYLVIDAVSLPHAFDMISIATLSILFAWSLPALFRLIARGFSAKPARKSGMVLSAMLWPCILGAMLWFGLADARTTVRSVAGKFATNLSESFALAQTLAKIEQLPVDSVYFSYDARPMTRQPNIHLFMVESYGRILVDNTFLNTAYSSMMHETEDLLRTGGWQAMTQYSEAPVTGGLSWLSMNTVLSGLAMANKTFYARYQSRIEQYPHLIRYLQRHQYHTLTLQPPNRARPGLPVLNQYAYNDAIFFDELNYNGPAYSIWVIPDQYSLGYTHHHYLRHVPEPFFLFFETATTHAPWTNLPPYMDDWRDLNSTEPISSNVTEAPLASQLRTTFDNRFYNERPDTVELYWKSIAYDLRVLRDYILNDAPPNSLFIILGDHQPPLLPSKSYQTPIHVISRDTTLIQDLGAFGFEQGMLRTSEPAPPLFHSGLYSMLIDLLTRTEQEEHRPLPTRQYRPNGITPSLLSVEPSR